MEFDEDDDELFCWLRNGLAFWPGIGGIRGGIGGVGVRNGDVEDDGVGGNGS